MNSTDTIARPVEIDEELDSTIGEQLGDEILAGTAAKEKVAKVGGLSNGNSGAIRSHQARAWTNSGNVD